MTLSTRRKIFYSSVVVSLIVILASAVVINRTLVNTPEFDMESISDSAGEPVTAYMAYMAADGSVVIGISERDDADTSEIISFVKNMQLGEEYIQEEAAQISESADAWIALYDDKNHVASRMNFYDDGNMVWYDGKRYNADPENMQQLIEYCNQKVKEDRKEDPTSAPEIVEE